MLTNDELPFPLQGSTLITGPSNSGKTRLTSKALEKWTSLNGSKNVIVLEFGPEYLYNGRVLGRHLSRFTTLNSDIWYGYLETYAPRAESKNEKEALKMASMNSERAETLISTLPPTKKAIFINDITIPLQSPSQNLDTLINYCDGAECSVINAFKGTELGSNDPISKFEKSSLSKLQKWADRTICLDL